MVVDLSVIILNYNTSQLTIDAISSIEENYPQETRSGQLEVIVADNASPDNSLESFKDYAKKTKIKTFLVVDNGGNIGFSKGNNNAQKYSKGRYILFLNPDTIVYKKTLNRMIEFMDTHGDAGAATCKLEVSSGGIDESSHRGFPTPWNGFTHFTKLEKLFPESRLFAGYTQGFKDFSRIHQVDVISGAFLFVRRDVGEQVGWWDEEYFFYGEDIQFCYNIRSLGYKIYYVPDVSILHYGGVSSGIKKQSHSITTADRDHRKIMQRHRFEAMKIFYRKNYSKKYPGILTWVVYKAIDYLHKKNTS